MVEMKYRKTIGILTDPSKTFKMTLGNRILQVQYDELSEEFRHKKQSFLDFLGGNFQEILTLIHELSFKCNVSVMLYVDKNLFISENCVSPYEIIHPKKIEESSDFVKWINGKDVLIISLSIGKLKDFINLYNTKIEQMNGCCIVSTGRSMISELTGRFKKITFLERKGVARFGADNRRKILALIGVTT